MSELQNSAAPPAKQAAGKGFDEWLAELQSLIARYRAEQAESEKCATSAATWTRLVAVHQGEAEKYLGRIVDLMRERCGDRFVQGLAAVGRVVADDLADAAAARAEQEWDMEDRAELPDGDIDLSEQAHRQMLDDEYA